MEIFTEIKGNIHAPEWKYFIEGRPIEQIDIDQWTAQKCRFTVMSDRGNQYTIALKRHEQLRDGDILSYDPQSEEVVSIRIHFNEVMVAELTSVIIEPLEEIIRTAVELGHALGNQHWRVVVKGTKVYVPITVDREVMESVMRTHHLEGVVCQFRAGEEVASELEPHEVRHLFGGASHQDFAHTGHAHSSHSHDEAPRMDCGCETK